MSIWSLTYQQNVFKCYHSDKHFSRFFNYDTHTHPFKGPFSGSTRVSRYRKVKPIWILLKQETVSGSGISWAICKSAPISRQITTPAPHHSVFYRPDALPAAQPTASKHWRHIFLTTRWRQNSTGIDVEQNYVTVTLCIFVYTGWAKNVAQISNHHFVSWHRKLNIDVHFVC